MNKVIYKAQDNVYQSEKQSALTVIKHVHVLPGSGDKRASGRDKTLVSAGLLAGRGHCQEGVGEEPGQTPGLGVL